MEFINSFSRIDFANPATRKQVSYEIIQLLWEQTVENGLIDQERNIMYKWFEDIARAGQKDEQVISQEDMHKFFLEKMCDTKSIQFMTKEGFVCFKHAFHVINQKGNKLVKIAKRKTDKQ